LPPERPLTPHSHRGLTTHLILKGQLTITYSKEQDSEKITHGVGDRIDVGANVVHEVWMGPEGCTYIIGE
jgi:quercetin dioxygenase-like cupin family protein